MTAFATTDYARVHRTEKRCRSKNKRGVMTDAAIIRGRDMINFLWGRDTGVMTGCAVANNT